MHRRPLFPLLLLFPVLLAGGCLLHHPAGEVAPVVAVEDGFQESSGLVKAGPGWDQPWWRTFNDPVLDELEREALAQNLGLQQLAARMEQADALHRQAGAGLFPTLSGSGRYDSDWNDLDDHAATTRSESASAGALLNWEVDVWGRLRSARRAQKQEWEASFYDLLGGRLLLSATVAETYFEILEQREQLRLLNEQIIVNETLLDLTRLRFGQGQSSVVDVLQQREQLASTRSLVPGVEARAGQLSYALDVLLGHAPGGKIQTSGGMPEVPSAFERTGIPSDLLSNRPDLLASRHHITALDYRVGEAIADRLPRFEIGGALTAVGDPGFSSLIGSAFGSIMGPLIDGGERRAVVALRRAQLQEAVADFSNNYLEAVRDVESALLGERKQAERVTLQERQLETARNLLTETRNRYSQGLTDYLPVLAALATQQGLERELITSRRELLNSRVALHRALGGPMREPAKLASRKTHEE